MSHRWKLTAGGASAQQKADRLRTRADKLGRQATAWETGAEREPAVGRRLADLPAGFTVFHDLRLPESGERVDHLVVSPGGLYLVDAKKYSGHLIYSKKMLWHGRFPIVDKLETLVWEAESLSDLLGREVVPVMCFVDAVLPQPVTTLGSVIVCRTSVLHTVVRSTHATMSPAEVARVLDTAAQLVTSRRNGEMSSSVPDLHLADATAELSIDADQLAAGPTDSVSFEPAATGQFASFQGAQVPTGQTPAISTIPPIGGPDLFGGPVRERVARRWPRRLIVGLVAASLVAGTAVVVWAVSRNSEKARIEAAARPTTTVAKPATSSADSAATDPVTTTTVLDIAAAGFSAMCPVPGLGWSLRPVWPGNQENLVWYQFDFENFDATWQEFALMTAPEFTQYTPTAVPPANARTIRIRAVYKGGRISDPVITKWTAPDGPC